MKLVVGFVPEHFSTPLFLAQSHGFYSKRGLEVELRPFPSGSGHLIQSLGDGSINVAVGLTEAFIKGQAMGLDHYKLIGTYVQSPLCWAISTGVDRAELNSASELEGKTCGISRFGSGSDVMSKVLHQDLGFTKPFKYKELHTFDKLRTAVRDGSADFFMWEYFTSKWFYDNKEIKKIGEIYTPWPSWVVTAHQSLLTREHEPKLRAFIEAVNEGVAYFEQHPDEAINYITTSFRYSEEDARAWLKTVEFSRDAGSIKDEVVTHTLSVLATSLELPAGHKSVNYIHKLDQ